MLVQKKYPLVKYTLHIELTQEEVEQLLKEFPSVVTAMQRQFVTFDCTPYFQRLAYAIIREAQLPYGC